MKLHVARCNGTYLVSFINFVTTGIPALSPELKMEAAVFPKFAIFLPDYTMLDLGKSLGCLVAACPGCSHIGFVYTLYVLACQWSMGRRNILFLLLSVNILICYSETENQLVRDTEGTIL